MSKIHSSIRRVIAHVCKEDPLASQLRIKRACSELNLDVSGLANEAILCVRRLWWPLSGEPAVRVGRAGLGALLQTRVSASLARHARTAVRPAREFVPAN